jgi:hypothetical protein
MAVYVLELVGRAEPYRQLLADPLGAGVPAELDSAASATGFHLHAFWPHDGVLHLIVEGDAAPGELGELVAERIAGEGWDPRWERAFAAEDPPADVEAGRQSEWIVEMAVPPRYRSCSICGWAGVPPHRPGSQCARPEDERLVAIRGDLPADDPGAVFGEQSGNGEKAVDVTPRKVEA